MASYDFMCPECGTVTEREFSMSEVKKRVKCPECGKMADRKWSVPNAINRISMFERSQYKNGHPRAHRGRGF